jgi:hypothetical protein
MATSMSDRITDIIIGDHVELMAENRRLREEVERMGYAGGARGARKTES